MPLSASQPRVATASPRASMPATIRSPYSADHRARVVGPLDQQRADHDRVRAGVEPRPHVVPRADAAAGLHRHVDRGADRAQRGLVLAGAERAVEVDHVQRARAGRDEGARAGDRVGVVARLARRVAALEPHGVAAAQVDRGVERERALHRAAMRRKLSSSRAPVVRLFSGWNCVAMTLSRATTAAKRSP